MTNNPNNTCVFHKTENIPKKHYNPIFIKKKLTKRALRSQWGAMLIEKASSSCQAVILMQSKAGVFCQQSLLLCHHQQRFTVLETLQHSQNFPGITVSLFQGKPRSFHLWSFVFSSFGIVGEGWLQYFCHLAQPSPITPCHRPLSPFACRWRKSVMPSLFPPLCVTMPLTGGQVDTDT